MLAYIILVFLASSYFNVAAKPIDASATSYKLSCNRITRLTEAAYREKRMWTINPPSLLAIKESHRHQYAFKTPPDQLIANKWAWDKTEDPRNVLVYSDSIWGINPHYIPQAYCLKKCIAKKVSPMEASQKLGFFIRSSDWVYQNSQKYKWPYIFLQSCFNSVIKGSAITVNLPSEMLSSNDSTTQYNILRLIDELLQKTDACTTLIILVSTPISENSTLVKSILDFLSDNEWASIKRIVIVTSTLDMLPNVLLNRPSYMQVDRQLPMFEIKRLLEFRMLPYLSAYFNKEISITEDGYTLLNHRPIYDSYPYGVISLFFALKNIVQTECFQHPNDTHIELSSYNIMTKIRKNFDCKAHAPSHTYPIYSEKVNQELIDFKDEILAYKNSSIDKKQQLTAGRYINGICVSAYGKAGSTYKLNIRQLTEKELAENEYSILHANDIIIRYPKDLLLGKDAQESIIKAILCADYYRETHHPKVEFPLRNHPYILNILPETPSILRSIASFYGPSWGAAYATLFISTFEDQIHPESVAITGTISPEGVIGGIGYIHAKFLGVLDGAECNRIKIMFFPNENRQELINSSTQYFIKRLEIHSVFNIDQLIQILKKQSTDQL